MSQFHLVFLSQSERLSWKRGLNSEGTVHKQEPRWMLWRAFQVPAKHVPRLHRRNALYCQLNLYKSSWMCSTGGEGSLRRAYYHPWSQIIPLLLYWTRQLLWFRQGCKVICAPCVRCLFHQSVVGQSGHDLCSRLLGTAQAEWQKARHHGNRTMLKSSSVNIEEMGTCLMSW